MNRIIKYITLVIIVGTMAACDKEQLYKTVELKSPQVSDTNWTATFLGQTVDFVEGGRTFRLSNPLDADNPYRDVQFSTLISSNDSRNIVSITLDLQNIVAPFGAQGWSEYLTIDIPSAEQGPTYEFVYDLNFDDWSLSYWGIPLVATGAFGIIREDNTMRYTVTFDDGSTVRLAQIQFSYALTEAGGE
jgi:hypothetical protein